MLVIRRKAFYTVAVNSYRKRLSFFVVIDRFTAVYGRSWLTWASKYFQIYQRHHKEIKQCNGVRGWYASSSFLSRISSLSVLYTYILSVLFTYVHICFFTYGFLPFFTFRSFLLFIYRFSFSSHLFFFPFVIYGLFLATVVNFSIGIFLLLLICVHACYK